ncbi:MAG: hypothetical protein J0L92_19330 [Deltaproteobacteria bacterium]|nr:hypothetical protein [Deltaproteobacteria bacterium]
MNARPMWIIVSALLLGACGGSPAHTDSPTGCVPRGSGAPPEGCEIVVGQCCYRVSTDACAAAGCTGRCLILESYPGQVQCE